ncbi:Spore germination protein KA [Haloplasma contractile SSD-17B]|uniref:Spore germination protein KA n=1 Tax=Haloplasma contractile SSD-17B TaxID=1033810 RepID=U2FK13_9MOLU|nr:Spore germination protein KA [Haloplasma contractile SSD-17B]
MIDGTPFVLIVPAVFSQFFQAAEDYYHRFIVASTIRMIRYFAFALGLLTPSFYIAITTFHQEMFPTPLLISVAAQREGIPFPAFIEALIMEVTFEILREAGIRMPRAVGSAVTVVGGLVIGQAAVEAGIVSGVMVIVVSLTAISNLINPTYNSANSVRFLRFVFMFLGATFGLYGISLGVYALILHLCSLRSFGVPYMTPFAPINMQQMKDAVVRFPLWSFFKRPTIITGDDTERQKKPNKERPKKPKQNKNYRSVKR